MDRSKNGVAAADLDQAKSAGMRSRSSLNGTARHRSSRSAKQSSSGIVSTSSRKIWRLGLSISRSARCAASTTRPIAGY